VSTLFFVFEAQITQSVSLRIVESSKRGICPPIRGSSPFAPQSQATADKVTRLRFGTSQCPTVEEAACRQALRWVLESAEAAALHWESPLALA
jgi:hypothetical protein